MKIYKIPFVNLTLQNNQIHEEVKHIFESFSQSSFFIKGIAVEEFEKAFASFVGTKYAIGVASGTDALYLSLMALNITAGDEIIMPVNTFIASAYAALFLGAKPVFVDIDPRTYNIDTLQLEKSITPKTKALIPVHIYGQAANMEEVLKIAKKHKLYVVEDAAQAHGATYKNRHVGTFGILTAWSFYPAKNLGAWGDGGIITTNSAKLAKKLKTLREYGGKTKYIFETIGLNSRLDALQAAILQIKLPHLSQWNKERQKSATYYSEKLSKLTPQIKIPFIDKNTNHVFHLYVIQTDRRDELLSYLDKRGIQTGIHYPIPLHLQKSLKNVGYKKGDFPVAEKTAKKLLSLPLFPGITTKQQDEVINHIASFFKK